MSDRFLPALRRAPRHVPSLVTLSALAVALLTAAPAAPVELLTLPEKPIDPQIAAYHDVVVRLHEKALRSSRPFTEEDLRKEVPSRYLNLEKAYAKVRDSRQKARAFAELALVDAELAWVDRIAPIEKEVARLDPELAAQLGHFAESDHFLARVVGVEPRWADAALKLAEAARDGYRELFGFETISKVPGKKIRILIHLDASHARPRLYFHPSPPYHGEFRYEIPDEKYLTLAGQQRIVYGFCHELGHMVAMWGKYGVVEDDHHAWAHYTGCLVVEKVYERLGNEPWPGWTAFQRRASGVARLKGDIEGQTPGVGTREQTLALFYRIGEEFGTDVYGRAWKWLEAKKRFRRLQHVPYLWLRDLRDALTAVLPADKRARVDELFGKS